MQDPKKIYIYIMDEKIKAIRNNYFNWTKIGAQDKEGCKRRSKEMKNKISDLILQTLRNPPCG